MGTGVAEGGTENPCKACNGVGTIDDGVIGSGENITKILSRLKKIMDKLEIGD